jgi:hypothetical protein
MVAVQKLQNLNFFEDQTLRCITVTTSSCVTTLSFKLIDDMPSWTIEIPVLRTGRK